MVYIFLNAFGIFAIENGKIVKYEIFKDPEEAARIVFEAKSKDELSEKEKEFIKDLKEVIFTYYKKNFKFEDRDFSEIVLQFLKEKIGEEKMKNFLIEFSNSFNILKTRKEKDRLIIGLISLIEENEKIINLMFERLRNFYSLYFPEFVVKESNEKILAKILENPKREGKSFGIEFSEGEFNFCKEYANIIKNLIELNKRFEKRLEEIVKEIAPNLYEIAGYKLAAKLIKGAGSLEKLAKMASSAIQLLGAEKALFRFLRGKGKPPKHGYIFLHPLVNQAPKKLRGKISRALASQLSKAAKIDYFSRRLEPSLKKQLEERIKEIYEGKGDI
jgi:nucleolar protein 56